MNDANALLAFVTDKALSLGIPVSRFIDPEVRINSRAKKRFGCCKRTSSGYIIEISERLLSSDEKTCLETLAHEVIHTCRGCQNHQKKWKEYAALLGEALGLDIERTGSPDKLGLSLEELEKEARYALICEGCGLIIKRTRRSRLIEHPEHYRCRCGGRLIPTEPPRGDKDNV